VLLTYTLWLLNVANWRITIFKFGKSSNIIYKWTICHSYVQ
jgi:hypothetical protein